MGVDSDSPQFDLSHLFEPANHGCMIRPILHLGKGRCPEFPTGRAEDGWRSGLPGQVHHCGEVLHHEVQGESRIEGPGKNKLFEFVFGAVIATGGGVENVDHHRRVEAEAVANEESFCRSDETGGRDQIVQGLHGVTRSQGPCFKEALSHGLKKGPTALQHGGIAPYHDGKSPVLCPRNST